MNTTGKRGLVRKQRKKPINYTLPDPDIEIRTFGLEVVHADYVVESRISLNYMHTVRLILEITIV